MIQKTVYGSPDISKVILQSLPSFEAKRIAVDVLRLDLIHPVVSGNKWFKLKYYLQQAVDEGKKGIITFGGAWSNHLVATAWAGREKGLSTFGIIRGEAPRKPSPTLQEVQDYGMQLRFVSRAEYREERIMAESLQQEFPDHLVIPQGGQGDHGVAGAAEMLNMVPLAGYTHIACAVGTGTMMAGLVTACLPHQKVIGISSLRANAPEHNSFAPFIERYAAGKQYELFFDYDFGGYAKYSPSLILFMNGFYERHGIPTDFVYTAKLFFAIHDLVGKSLFSPGNRLLVIHSGGLQGNRSIAGNLRFEV